MDMGCLIAGVELSGGVRLARCDAASSREVVDYLEGALGLAHHLWRELPGPQGSTALVLTPEAQAALMPGHDTLHLRQHLDPVVADLDRALEREVAVALLGSPQPFHFDSAAGFASHVRVQRRICRAAAGDLDLEEVFYLRPVGQYSDRQGKKYAYTPEQRAEDLELCRRAAARYRDMLAAGFAEEHARGILPFDYRQHFVVSFSLRAFLHFMDLRAKLDAQEEIRVLCDLMWPHLVSWAPEIAAWYEKTRLHKARLAP